MWTTGDVSSFSGLVNLTFLDLEDCEKLQGALGRFQIPVILLYETAEAVTVCVCSGTVTPQLVRIITNLKEKDFSGMGPLQLAQDLSELADMERIDLSSMTSLQGTTSSVSFCYMIPPRR